ncbi:type I restriction-modification system subunit M [Tetragenococcus koreensis]|nr:type I restriction-modification system subunit M [Tetragenococcus koreensis]
MTVSEYKNYVLGFLFYRYLSVNQERYLIENNVLDIAKNECVNEVYLREAIGHDLGDYLDDISSSLGYAIEPEDTWESLIRKIDNSTLQASDYQTIFDHFEKNSQLNIEAASYFSGIFDDVNISDPRLGTNTTCRARSLTKIVRTIDELSFENSNGQVMVHSLFENLIEQFANSAGKSGGEFYTSHSVSTLLGKLVTDGVPVRDNTFMGYDMSSGSGSTLLALKKEVPDEDRSGAVKLYGTEKELTTYNLSRMNLLIGGMSYKNTRLNNADTLGADWPDGSDELENNQPRVFDAVVSDIQFSANWYASSSLMKDPRFSEYGKLAPKGTADYAFVLHGLYHLDKEGTMAVVLPQGVLFRGGVPGQSGAQAESFIRKNLIEHPSGNRIHAVIGLPENIMFAAKGKKSVAVTIVVFKKKSSSNDILFIDAKDDFEKGKNRNYLTGEILDKIIQTYSNRINVDKYAHLASIEEIRENEYNLNISRYVDNFKEEAPIDLDEVEWLLEEDDAAIAKAKTEINQALVLLGIKKL